MVRTQDACSVDVPVISEKRVIAQPGRKMQKLGISKGRPQPSQRTFVADQPLKTQLVELISKSTNLDARLWLDGIYTELENKQLVGDWMIDRDVYFKIEGRTEPSKNGPEDSQSSQ
jgi:hypothetical protein